MIHAHQSQLEINPIGEVISANAEAKRSPRGSKKPSFHGITQSRLLHQQQAQSLRAKSHVFDSCEDFSDKTAAAPTAAAGNTNYNYRKAYSSESNQLIVKGNLVFTKSPCSHSHSVHAFHNSKTFKEFDQLVDIEPSSSQFKLPMYHSPMYHSREGPHSDQKLPLSNYYLIPREQESTNEKIQENQSSNASSPRSELQIEGTQVEGNNDALMMIQQVEEGDAENKQESIVTQEHVQSKPALKSIFSKMETTEKKNKKTDEKKLKKKQEKKQQKLTKKNSNFSFSGKSSSESESSSSSSESESESQSEQQSNSSNSPQIRSSPSPIPNEMAKVSKQIHAQQSQLTKDESNRSSALSTIDTNFAKEKPVAVAAVTITSSQQHPLGVTAAAMTSIPKPNEMTPAQRRKSQLQPVETMRFQTIVQKNKQLDMIVKAPKTPLTPKEKLKIVATVARTITRLQNNQVDQIVSTDQLNKTITEMRVQQSSALLNSAKLPNSAVKQAKYDAVDLAIKQVRMIELICDFAERGHSEDIQEIINLLQKDPKRNIRSTTDPEHIINKFNSRGQNAAYLACKNGNLNVLQKNYFNLILFDNRKEFELNSCYFLELDIKKIVQFLVKVEANFNLKSKLATDLEEFPLQAATRWNHKEVVAFLLSQRVTNISSEQIKLSYKEKTTKPIKELIGKHLKKKTFFLCC